jgi:hypothetical protein
MHARALMERPETDELIHVQSNHSNISKNAVSIKDRRLGHKLKSPQSSVFLFLVFCLLFSSFGWNIFHIEKEQLIDNLTVDDRYIISTMLLYANGPELPGP